MGDGASSSRGRGETVVIDHGRRRASCGYCRSSGYTSVSHGLWANSITADDYQELLDHGWRRSGCFLYKPEMERTCCPSYTIRLKASDFIPSKEQVRVHKKMQRFLDGFMDTRDNESKTAVSESSAIEQSNHVREQTCKEDEFIHYLSEEIDDAVNAMFGGGEFSSTDRLPKAVVKEVIPQVKKKLRGISEDLLYTSSISFQIAAAIRRSQCMEKNIHNVDISSDSSQSRAYLDLSPKVIAEKLACLMEQLGGTSGLLIKACNGHLNFYSATRLACSEVATANTPTQTLKSDRGDLKRSGMTSSSAVRPHKRRKHEIRMKRSSFDPEEFALYRKYQIKVHNDKPEKVTESSYRRFLVDSPIIFVPPQNGNKVVPPCGFGSFHQQYVIDGKLVAVGVVDILPRCLSSKYLFWDPDFAFLSLGKYSALQEINWVKETQVQCPTLQYYYLGYYIHSCSKMRYKASYRPSELLCPLQYKWVPFDVARPLLDKKAYVVLSDSVAQQDQAMTTQVPNISSSPDDHQSHNESSSDEEEEMDLEYEASDIGMDDESDPETGGLSTTDDFGFADISNILIDLNGSRVKFKDLQRAFGPIERRHIAELEMQLRRYVKVVGKELSGHIVYSLG